MITKRRLITNLCIIYIYFLYATDMQTHKKGVADAGTSNNSKTEATTTSEQSISQNDDFVPSGYEIPSSSNGYTKFQQGETKIRILSSPLIGYEGWVVTDKGEKPVRKEKQEELPKDAQKIRHFWSVMIWNYTTSRIEIWTITQKGLMKKLLSLKNDEDWGNPRNYNIKVAREGEGLDTKWELRPLAQFELSDEIRSALLESDINLSALYSTDENPYGGQPFGNKGGAR